ncbi:hypothetical protein GGR57DRAFT_504143 [Xylariaceae sp. FL1272]|nr:hypothetical protein GGR57DRAFT_504143 [Xylariaceae sp. FL1272]
MGWSTPTAKFQKEAIFRLMENDEDEDEVLGYTSPSVKMHERKLSDFFDSQNWTDIEATLMWEYDYGAGWEHSITLMGRDDQRFRRSLRISPAAELPAVCLAGEGHSAEENCGPESWREWKRKAELNVRHPGNQ